MKQFQILSIQQSLTSAVVIGLIIISSMVTSQGSRKPNYVIFLADDMGWGDLSSYGHPTQEYGAVDRMAAEGLRFTQWYSAAPVCTPSRAALLTGRLPIRSGMYGDIHVLHPGSSGGLPHWEITIAEALKTAGYVSGIVGKWHLGINEAVHNDGKFLPHTQGFDYVGSILPESLLWSCDTSKRHKSQPTRTSCFLYQNSTIVQQPIDLGRLSDVLVEDAKAFLYNNTGLPFFLYVALPQCHTPMFNKPCFKGKSKRGVYGDQVNEMSWIVGETLATIKKLNLDSETLSLFLSDNGPHVEICEEGGHAGQFKEGKLYYAEGGFRVPAIARWPGVIEPGRVISAVTNTMDIFPTLLQLSGVQLPSDRLIDGRSFAHLLSSESHSDEEISRIKNMQYFYCKDRLIAIRYFRYKIYFYKSQFPSREFLNGLCHNGFPLKNFMNELDCSNEQLQKWLVYDVEADPSENWPINFASLAVDIKLELRQLLEEHDQSKWDSRKSVINFSDVHQRLKPCCNPPYCMCNYARDISL